MNDLIILPASIPMDSVKMVVAAVRGNHENPKQILHAALTVQAWAAGLWINGSFNASGLEDTRPAVDQLESLTQEGGPIKANALNWKIVVSTILALIQQLINEA